jgi:hypothetical protein
MREERIRLSARHAVQAFLRLATLSKLALANSDKARSLASHPCAPTIFNSTTLRLRKPSPNFHLSQDCVNPSFKIKKTFCFGSPSQLTSCELPFGQYSLRSHCANWPSWPICQPASAFKNFLIFG